MSYIDWFLMLNQHCIPRVNLLCHDMLSFLYIVRFTLLKFNQNFCISLYDRYWSMVFFFFLLLVVSLSGLDIWMVLASFNELGNILSFSVLWKSLYVELILVAAACRVSSCGLQAPEFTTFNSCGAWAQQLQHMGLVAWQHVEFSQTRDRTCLPCTDMWILTHRATREVLNLIRYIELFRVFHLQ